MLDQGTAMLVLLQFPQPELPHQDVEKLKNLKKLEIFDYKTVLDPCTSICSATASNVDLIASIADCFGFDAFL